MQGLKTRREGRRRFERAGLEALRACTTMSTVVHDNATNKLPHRPFWYQTGNVYYR